MVAVSDFCSFQVYVREVSFAVGAEGLAYAYLPLPPSPSTPSTVTISLSLLPLQTDGLVLAIRHEVLALHASAFRV